MLKVYNTLTGKKEEFIPVEDNRVKMYICGLTVQNYSHVGHIRSTINYDVIRRYLEYKGYDVYCIQNFTDINEKIVKRAREENMAPLELAEKYTRAYLEDIDNLNIKRADKFCTATENIDKIIEIVKKLIDKGYAYEVNGNVYFSVEKYDDYGKLSGRKLEEMEAGARIGVKEEKKHPLDFALWKKIEEKDLIKWDSPWGEGWPGWHIECSAMSLKYLGEKFDIHGGGTDLIFPHHENEIAQSEACTGKKPFVKYWLHNGTVNIKGEKMSKSLGNFFTTRELLNKFTGDEIRYFLLTKHYHSPLDFSLEEIENTAVSYNKIINTRKELKRKIAKKTKEKDKNKETDYKQLQKDILSYKKEFEKAMDDDFNTAEAIGIMHKYTAKVNSFLHNKDIKLTEKVKQLLLEADQLYNNMFQIMGFQFENQQEINPELTGRLIDYIVNLREEAREKNNWEYADKIRDDLQEMGIVIKDTPEGPQWEIERK